MINFSFFFREFDEPALERERQREDPHLSIERLVSWWCSREGRRVNKINTRLPVESLNVHIRFYSNHLFSKKQYVDGRRRSFTKTSGNLVVSVALR